MPSVRGVVPAAHRSAAPRDEACREEAARLHRVPVDVHYGPPTKAPPTPARICSVSRPDSVFEFHRQLGAFLVAVLEVAADTELFSVG